MRHSLVFILCIGFLPLSVKSQQDFDPEKTFYDAEFLVIYENYQEALPLYLALVDSGYENANVCYKIGQCFLNIPGKKHHATPYLEKAILNKNWRSKTELFTEEQAPFNAELLLAKAYHVNDQIPEALQKYTYFETEATKALEEFNTNVILVNKIREDLDAASRGMISCELFQQMKENPVDHDFRLAANLNIGSHNFRPIISGDGNTMVFMSNRRYYDAVYLAHRRYARWDTPGNITMELESDGTYNPLSLSFNGSRLFLVHEENANFDLYESIYLKDRWSRMSPLNSNINTPDDEIHACLSPDGKTLYFVSNKKGGEGGFDIYKSEYQPEQGWGEAINLGQSVNTPYDEHSPYLTEDGKTLYFSSKGHPGFGGYDIFCTHKQPDGGWSEPKNIGYPVNTTDDDLNFCPSGSGELGYMDKFIADGTERRIYEVEFYSETNPRKAQIIGIVDLESAELPVERDVQISLINNNTRDTVTTFTIENVNGEYSFRVNPGEYRVVFEKDGYEKRTERLSVTDNDRDRTIELNTILAVESEPAGEIESPVQKEYIGFVLFAFDDYSLSKTATRELDQIYRILDQRKDIRLKVTGHTDSKGSDTYNISLSEKRARSVSGYLSKKGIHAGRLEPEWKGESEPVAININPDGSDNPQGRRFNRRVVFTFRDPVPDTVEIKKLEIPDQLKIR